jgi:hypothetical protein
MLVEELVDPSIDKVWLFNIHQMPCIERLDLFVGARRRTLSEKNAGTN